MKLYSIVWTTENIDNHRCGLNMTIYQLGWFLDDPANDLYRNNAVNKTGNVWGVSSGVHTNEQLARTSRLYCKDEVDVLLELIHKCHMPESFGDITVVEICEVR